MDITLPLKYFNVWVEEWFFIIFDDYIFNAAKWLNYLLFNNIFSESILWDQNCTEGLQNSELFIPFSIEKPSLEYACLISTWSSHIRAHFPIWKEVARRVEINYINFNAIFQLALKFHSKFPCVGLSNDKKTRSWNNRFLTIFDDIEFCASRTIFGEGQIEFGRRLIAHRPWFKWIMF